jgi:cellulose synthase/poly-beta-1,6-N-acetylglucosamine synthase-like glycosyltransferase
VISIVVPAYNSQKTIGPCLDALLAQTTPRESYEIIVVDDGSTDATAEMAQARGALVIRQPNRGAGAARNSGAQHATGEIIMFVDADSVPDRCFVAKLAAPFCDPDIAGASGEKKTRQTNLWARFVQAEYDFKYELIAAHPKIDFVDSSTAAYRRKVFLGNGGFDSMMMEAEDTELSFRLAERGCKMVLVRDAIAYHSHPESPLDFLVRKYRYAVWRSIVYARMPRKMASETRTPQAQKLQVLFAFALLPAALGGLLFTGLAWAAAFLLVLFVATTFSFVRWSWQSDRAVALVAPFIFLLAAYAGGLGLVVGLSKWHGKSSYQGRC